MEVARRSANSAWYQSWYIAYNVALTQYPWPMQIYWLAISYLPFLQLWWSTMDSGQHSQVVKIYPFYQQTGTLSTWTNGCLSILGRSTSGWRLLFAISLPLELLISDSKVLGKQSKELTRASLFFKKMEASLSQEQLKSLERLALVSSVNWMCRQSAFEIVLIVVSADSTLQSLFFNLKASKDSDNNWGRSRTLLLRLCAFLHLSWTLFISRKGFRSCFVLHCALQAATGKMFVQGRETEAPLNVHNMGIQVQASSR